MSLKQTIQPGVTLYYTITANGKKVLREWLQTPEGTLRLESEPLLKMLFADIDKTTVKTQLNHIRTKLIDEIKTTQLGLNEALNQGFYFEDNTALNAQLLRLLNELLEARTRWLVESIEASQRLAAQPDDADAAREIYRAESERLGKLLATLEGL